MIMADILNRNLNESNSLRHLLNIRWWGWGDWNYHTFTLYCSDDLITQIKKQFILISINAQSLKAKIDDIKLMINKFNGNSCIISAIHLQETWLKSNSICNFDPGNIQEYHFISKEGTCSRCGGLAIYLHYSYNYTIHELRGNRTDYGKTRRSQLHTRQCLINLSFCQTYIGPLLKMQTNKFSVNSRFI